MVAGDLTTEKLGGYPAVHPEKEARETKEIQLTRAVSDVGAGLLVADTVLPLLLAPSVAHVSADRAPPGEQPMQD